MNKYFDIVDTNSESKDTLLNAHATLQKELEVGEDLQHIIVTVDAKIFPLLQSIKQEDETTFDWLIPFLWDFHLENRYENLLECWTKTNS